MNSVITVRYAALGIILLSLIIACISRKNSSKYKSIPAVRAFTELIRQILQRGQIVNTARLEAETEKKVRYMITYAWKSLMAVGIIFFLLSFMMNEEKRTIRRPDTGAAPTVAEISVGDEKKSLQINPREYTREEFDELAQRAVLYLKENVPGSGDEADRLTLPKTDETGNLEISWSSSAPEVISASGYIFREEIEREATVTLTAEIGCNDFSVTADFPVTVGPEAKVRDDAMDKLMECERDSRTSTTLELPEEVDGQRVRIKNSDAERFMYVFILAAILAVMLIYYKYYKLKNEGEKLKRKLSSEYFSFVNRLTLYIGAGLSMDDALVRAAAGASKTLQERVGFCMNRISTGVPQAKAYAEFAGNTGLQEYMRIMSLLSQNMEHGSKRLISLLDQEVKTAMNLNREQIHRKGQEASEKLLIPTCILLIVVLGIICYPALVSFM